MPDDHAQNILDCIIIGGGPAGLTAAIYLARFRRSCVVVDAGDGRATYIPQSHNYPGFPPGVSGSELVSRLKEQALAYGARIEEGEVQRLETDGEGFRVTSDSCSYLARRLILATGIDDTLPDMPDVHDAIRASVVRLCAICDGYEVNGHSVGVYGEADTAIDHAVFLRTFTDKVKVIVHGDSQACSKALDKAGRFDIELISDRVDDLRATDQGVEVTTCKGEVFHFDIVYPTLGNSPRSMLVRELGVECDGEGAIVVDDHQLTSRPGLYAIGDVVVGLKQISVATGQAAQAATAVHNSLEANPWRS